MKKENFVTLVMGTVSGLIFALGMCMCLLPEWNAFNTGLGCGILGLIGILITVITYRKMSGKQPIKVSLKTIGKALYGTVSALVLGAGMAMIMAFEGMLIQGMLVGIVGIVLLLFLIPMCVGFKKTAETN